MRKKAEPKSLVDWKRMQANEIAEVFLVTPQAVGLWRKNQRCPRNRDGTYDLRAVIGWWRETFQPRVGVEDQQRARQEEIKTRRMEIELGILEGTYIPIEEVERGWVARIRAAKNAFWELTKQLPPFLENRKARDIQKVLADAIRHILDEFSRE